RSLSLGVDSNPLELASELVPVLLVRRAHVRPFIYAHVGGIVSREDVRVGVIDAAGPDLLAIDIEGGRSAFAASAVVGEVELDGRFAWSKRFGGVDRVLVKAHMVVGVRRLAIHHVETPPAEASALAEDNAVSATFGNLHVRRDRHR